MTMNPTIKQQWINKLRDGTVQQATAMLEDAHGAMCCLGVLMLCQGPTPVEYFSAYAGNDPDYGEVSKKLMASTVPQQFNAGLEKREMNKLAVMNDGGWYNPTLGTLLDETEKDGTAQEFKKHTFAEIADYIEKNL